MTINMMQKYFFSKFTEEIAGIAVKALMYEVTVSPKPGLVDRFHNGAHVDMDFYTYSSADSSFYSNGQFWISVVKRKSKANFSKVEI